MTLFKNYLKILTICAGCSFFPFMTIGMFLGAPSYILASIVITAIFRKELS